MLSHRSGAVAAALLLTPLFVLAPAAITAIAADSSSTPASKPSAPASKPKASDPKPKASDSKPTVTVTLGGKPGPPPGYKHLGGTTTITQGDLSFESYIAFPRTIPGPNPAVIIIQEWWGLNDQIKTVADDLVRKGYVVMAPDLYHGKVTIDPNVAAELLKALPTDRALNELAATYAHLRSLHAVGDRPIGAIGFCMGGGLSLRLAMRVPELRACVVCYGRPETDPAKLQTIKAPVLGIYGGKDTGIPASLVEEFQKAMLSAGKSATIKVYPEAGHAFMNPDNPTHRPDDTNDAWTRIDAFFGEHLKPRTAKVQ